MSDDLRVVSCFDNTVGHKGVFNFDAYLQFLNSLFLLAEKNKQINFVFKGKKNLLYMNLSFNHELESLLNKLEQLDNFIVLHKPLVTTFELIGLSDLVISAPRSSVIYEALCGGVKAISFDPLNQCSVYNDITQSFHNLNAYTDDELNNLFEYWMFNSSKKEFEIFLNRYVKPNLDKNASKGNMIIRFKNYLKN
jgi:polysaccharide biosynthesis PFTS motif protein